MKAEGELDIKQKYEMGKSAPGRGNSMCKGPGASEGNLVRMEDERVVENEK